jgi:hypothetical protein
VCQEEGETFLVVEPDSLEAAAQEQGGSQTEETFDGGSLRWARALRDLSHLGPEERQTVEMMSRAIIKKLLHHPFRSLKDTPEDEEYVAMARRLFNLPEMNGGAGACSLNPAGCGEAQFAPSGRLPFPAAGVWADGVPWIHHYRQGP